MASNKSLAIHSLEAFLAHMAIPKACVLNKPVFKKMFLECGLLNAADKACLKDDAEKVRWRYTLKPGTINIAAYKDKEREYPEIAILSVALSNPKRVKRIAYFMQRAIPYPLILIFTASIDNATHIAISLADKRTNQADKGKWVVEDSVQTSWIELKNQSQAQADFLHSCKIQNFSFKDFWSFYRSFMDRVIAINCAAHGAVFSLGNQSSHDDGANRLSMLRNIERLDARRNEVSKKLKNEKQIGKQVEMNTQVKQINDEIEQIKSRL